MEQCPECGKAQAVPVAADGDAAGLSAANSTEDLSDVTQTCPRCHKSLSIAYTPGRELSCSYCVAKLRIAPDKSVVSIPDDSSEAPPDGTETCPDSNEASQSDMEPPPPNPATVIYVKAIILSVILVPVIATAIYLAAGGGRSGRRRFDEWGIRFSAPPGWNKWTGSKEYQAVEMLQSQLGGTGRHVTHAALWETPDKRAVFVVGMYRAASDEYLQSLQSSERNHMEAEQRRGNVTKIHELAIVNVGGRDAVKSDTERSSGVRSECYYLPDTPNVVCIMMLARRSSEFGTYHEQIKGSLAGLSIGSRRSDRDVRDPDDAGEAGEFPTLTLALILASLTALPVLARMGRVRSCERKVRGLIARDQADYRVRRLLEKAFGRFPDTAVGRRVANCALFFFFPLAIVLGYLCSLASLHFGWCCLAGVVLGGVAAGFLSDWISQISDEKMTLRKLRASLQEEFPELWHKLAAYWRQEFKKMREEEKKEQEKWNKTWGLLFGGGEKIRQQTQTYDGWNYWGEEQMLPCPFCGKRTERARLQVFGGIDAVMGFYDTSQGGRHIKQKCEKCGKTFLSRLAPDEAAIRHGASFHQWR